MQIKDYLEQLASDHPTPGGGSASALAGALAASLVSMTAGLSVKKGMLEKKKVMEIRKKALALQGRLSRSVEEDAQSYDEVLKAFRLPKDTEKERSRRSRMIQKAYQKATVTPRRVCEDCLPLLEFSRTLVSKGNPNAFSDAGVAAFLAGTAIEGGLLNIRINLGAIKDRTFVRKMEGFVRQTAGKKAALMRPILKGLEEKG
jgi:formiminotetrahydrofolate cyclodeaminase